MILCFGEFELDSSLYQVRRSGCAVHLSRRAFDVLAHLIEQRHRVVTKEELLARFWEGRSVTEGTLSQLIKSIRDALASADQDRRIETVRSRGFRFNGSDVVCLNEPSADTPTPTSGVHRVARVPSSSAASCDQFCASNVPMCSCSPVPTAPRIAAPVLRLTSEELKNISRNFQPSARAAEYESHARRFQ